MNAPRSIPERISALLAESGPLTKRMIMTEMHGCTLNQTNKALAILKNAGSARFDHKTKQWKHLAHYRKCGPARFTQQEFDAVYRACTARRSAAIAAESGVNKARVKGILVRLYLQQKIHYCHGQGWQQTNPSPDTPAPPKEPSSTMQDDIAWQRYWHPLNREQRRLDALNGVSPP